MRYVVEEGLGNFYVYDTEDNYTIAQFWSTGDFDAGASAKEFAAKLNPPPRYVLKVPGDMSSSWRYIYDTERKCSVVEVFNGAEDGDERTQAILDMLNGGQIP